MSALGMTATVMATELWQAIQADTRAGHGDLAEGRFGPAAATYIRDVASAYLASGGRSDTLPAARAPIAAIEFALEASEGLEFLRAWLHGEWDVIRREWPEAPAAVFVDDPAAMLKA